MRRFCWAANMLGPQRIASRRCAPNAILNKWPPPSISLQPPAGWACHQGLASRCWVLLYGATLAAGLLSSQLPEEPVGDPFFSALEILIILLAPLTVVLMVCGELPVLSQRALNEPVTAMIQPGPNLYCRQVSVREEDTRVAFNLERTRSNKVTARAPGNTS